MHNNEPCDLKLNNLVRATWGPKSYTSQLVEASHDRRKNERNERDLYRPPMLSFMLPPARFVVETVLFLKPISNLDPRSPLRMTAGEGGALRNPGTRLPLIGFIKKDNKRVTDWSIQVRTRAGERVA